MAQPDILWIEQPKESWRYSSEGRSFEHQYTVERRQLSQLRRHEKPSRYRVDKIVKAMREGAAVELPEVDADGLVLDGHARVTAAIRVVGKEAMVPLHVHRLVELETAPAGASCSPNP